MLLFDSIVASMLALVASAVSLGELPIIAALSTAFLAVCLAAATGSFSYMLSNLSMTPFGKRHPHEYLSSLTNCFPST